MGPWGHGGRPHGCHDATSWMGLKGSVRSLRAAGNRWNQTETVWLPSPCKAPFSVFSVPL